MWDEQRETFTKHYRVLRFDMCGFENLIMQKGPFPTFRICTACCRDSGSKVHMYWATPLGETALDFTLEHSEMMWSLFVVIGGPSGFEMRGEFPSLLLEMLWALEQGDLDRVSDLQIHLWVDGTFRQPEQADFHFCQRVTEMNRIPVENGTWVTADDNSLNPLNPPAAGHSGEVGFPVLFIASVLDSPEILRTADVLAEGIKGTKKLLCLMLPT